MVTVEVAMVALLIAVVVVMVNDGAKYLFCLGIGKVKFTGGIL